MRREYSMPHKSFAETDEQFRIACKLAGVEPTKRQVSKYRRGYGSAYGCMEQARIALLGKVVA